MDQAVNSLTFPVQDPKTIMLLIHNTEFQFCIPPDAKNPSFYRAMKTGDHNYSSEDWGILLKWIEDNKK